MLLQELGFTPEVEHFEPIIKAQAFHGDVTGARLRGGRGRQRHDLLCSGVTSALLPLLASLAVQWRMPC